MDELNMLWASNFQSKIDFSVIHPRLQGRKIHIQTHIIAKIDAMVELDLAVPDLGSRRGYTGVIMSSKIRYQDSVKSSWSCVQGRKT